MKFEDDAIRLLSRKKSIQSGIETILETIEYLEILLNGPRTTSWDSDKTGKYAADYEESRRISFIEKIENLQAKKAELEHELKLIELCYSALTPYQRDLLDTFFSSGERHCAETLCERYFKERSQIYRDRKKALDVFSNILKISR